MTEISTIMADPRRRVCAWCGWEMAAGTEPATHGLCGPCAAHWGEAAPFEDPVTQHHVGLVPARSSNVGAAGWYAVGASGVAVVQFVSGAVYRYEDVPRGWWLGYLRAPSKGHYLATTLRADVARFPCTKIAEAVRGVQPV